MRHMLRIKKLDIFMAKQFGLLFCGTFFICQFVLMMQFLWRYVDELIGKGLSMEVLAQFFWYMGLILVPQAFPLAILLASLITFGNLGESSELTAIKAAGISLMQSMRSLIVIVCGVACLSFYFQDVIGPSANLSFRQLLVSMKQKSPELEIPEGIFYDGIPGSNLYVQRKDMATGKLYGVMIYKMNGSYEDAAIILADSGMMQSTAEKKHLLLTLWSGEWFENMQQTDMAGSASVPYRRETFAHKRIVLDFDSGFNMSDNDFGMNATTKDLGRILHDADSLRQAADSCGHAYWRDARQWRLPASAGTKADSIAADKLFATHKLDPDSTYNRLSSDDKLAVARAAYGDVRSMEYDLEMKSDFAETTWSTYRRHQIEAYNKFTGSLICIIFFFIGAPLGAIIRKGGLGVPVIISVLIFIIYYILENTGTRMVRENIWVVWYGKLISTALLTPLAVFFTYKANKDSTVFNIDAYMSVVRSILAIRTKRYVAMKEVVIEDPDYAADTVRLATLCSDIRAYSHEHRLLHAPNPITIFFHAGDDQEVRRIKDELEEVIDDLANTKDKIVSDRLNHYPILAPAAHTRPFRKRWMNIITGLLLPVAAVIYLRIWFFRARLLADLRQTVKTSEEIAGRINSMTNPEAVPAQ